MDNTEIAERVIEAWNGNNIEALRDIYADDAVDHWGPEGLGSTFSGLDEIIEAESKFRHAFPDYSMELLRVADGGELVAHHWVITGTHEGEFMGIPATGNSVTYDGMAFHRVEDGNIVESWWITNRLRLLRELGVVPSDQELAEAARSQ